MKSPDSVTLTFALSSIIRHGASPVLWKSGAGLWERQKLHAEVAEVARRKATATATANTGVSPLRMTMKLSCSGRDDRALVAR